MTDYQIITVRVASGEEPDAFGPLDFADGLRQITLLAEEAGGELVPHSSVPIALARYGVKQSWDIVRDEGLPKLTRLFILGLAEAEEEADAA